MKKDSTIQPQSQPAPGESAGLRRFLYATAAITGGAILIVEILGAKMLAPFVGTSHFVWTAQITVTLLALASGYYFGGWLVDRSPKLERLYFCILAAALYLAVTVPLTGPLAYLFLNLNLAVGALLSSLFLFFVPLTLLAATGPFLVRILARSLTNVGGQVGALSAVSTVGSVAGTLLIGYVLIPLLPNSWTMFATAALLASLSGAYFALFGRRLKPALAGQGAVAVLIVLGAVAEAQGRPIKVKELFRGNSNFGTLQVIESPRLQRRFFLNDYLVQNSYDPNSRKSSSLFTYMLHGLAHAYHTNLSSALCIGMGIGIVPMQLAVEGVRVEVVEINPAVIPVAEQFFDFDRKRMTIHIGDGRFFLNKNEKRFDAVLLDAFLGDSSPGHLMTREAFEGIRRALTERGVLVINSFGNFRPGEEMFTASLEKTVRAVFPYVTIHAAGNGNIFFVASASPLVPGNFDTSQVAPDQRDEVLTAWRTTHTVPPEKGMVLTDDYNPIEFYDATNRERHRRILAEAIRDL
ncbi:MAG: fused MFS/spermidine synthase [Verrucomicrobiota bacterium]|nr:fused MFS/spermidine synthase [Verrucomicrobiota bacterium]